MGRGGDDGLLLSWYKGSIPDFTGDSDAGIDRAFSSDLSKSLFADSGVFAGELALLLVSSLKRFPKNRPVSAGGFLFPKDQDSALRREQGGKRYELGGICLQKERGTDDLSQTYPVRFSSRTLLLRLGFI